MRRGIRRGRMALVWFEATLPLESLLEWSASWVMLSTLFSYFIFLHRSRTPFSFLFLFIFRFYLFIYLLCFLPNFCSRSTYVTGCGMWLYREGTRSCLIKLALIPGTSSFQLCHLSRFLIVIVVFSSSNYWVKDWFNIYH